MQKLIFKNLNCLLFCIVFGLLLAHVSALFMQWYGLLTSPWDLDYAESWHAYSAYQPYQGGDTITSAYAMPYNALPYPPISYLLHGWLGKMTGSDLIGVRTIGRAMTLIMTVLNSIMIFAIGRGLGIRILWSGMAGLLFLISDPAHFFAVSLRPDEMGLAFTLLGLYSVIRGRNYYLAGSLFALALATKHSFITLPLVLLVTLLIRKELRSAIKLLASGCVVGLSIALLSTWILGPYWWQGSLLQGFHGANFKQAIFFVGAGFKQPLIPIALASITLIGLKGLTSIISASFLVSLGFNCIALVKVGAAGNYFLEPVALASILCAQLAEKVLNEKQLMFRGFALTLILSLILPSTVEHFDVTIKSLRARSHNDFNPRPLIEMLKSIEGPILADQSWMYFQSSHKPFNNPPDLIAAAVEGSKIDGSSMQQFIEHKGFKVIVVDKNWKERGHFPQSWISAIENNYELLNTDFEYNVMKPKGDSKSSSQ